MLPRLGSEQEREIKNMGVEAVYLFGSRAQGREGPASDYDYAVLMPRKGFSKGDPLYFKLRDLLSAISPRDLENDVIDIVFLRDAGLELAFHVIRYGLVLFDANPKERLRFEEKTCLLYYDYRPVLQKMDAAILEAL